MKTLRRLGLPTLVFVTKIDRAGAREEGLLDDIRRRLTPYVVPLTDVTDIGTPYARVAPRPLDDTAAGTLAEVDPDILAAVVDGPAPTPDDLTAALTAHTADGAVALQQRSTATTATAREPQSLGITPERPI